MNRKARLPRYRIAAGALALAALAAGGCLSLQDDTPTELVIVLFWEDGSDGSQDEDRTCETAGVDRVSWTLVRQRDDGRRETVSESDIDETCSNELAFTDVPPGNYTLEVRGDDERGRMEWKGSCGELYVDRFSELYPCQAFLVEGSNPMSTGSRDAGMRSNDAGMRGNDAGMDGKTE